MNRDFKDSLNDMIDACEKTMEFTNNMDEKTFTHDAKTVYAVIRALEVLGEASKVVPESIRKSHNEIPWKDIAGMRDKLIHHYFGIDYKLIWNTAKNKIPTIYNQLKKVKE